MLAKDQRDDIRARCEAATPVTGKYTPCDCEGGTPCGHPDYVFALGGAADKGKVAYDIPDISDANIDIFLHAKSDQTALLDACERLEKRVRQLEDAMSISHQVKP